VKRLTFAFGLLVASGILWWAWSPAKPVAHIMSIAFGITFAEIYWGYILKRRVN